MVSDSIAQRPASSRAKTRVAAASIPHARRRKENSRRICSGCCPAVFRGGKNRIAGLLRQRVDLPVGHQRLLRVAGALAHVIGVADFAVGERHARRQRRVLAAGADKNRSVHRVMRHQQAEGFFRSLGVGARGQSAGEIVGVNLHRHVNLLQILPAGPLRRVLVAFRTESPHHGGEDDHQRQHDEQFDERKTGLNLWRATVVVPE